MQGHKRRLYENNASPAQAPLKTGNGHVAFTNLAPQTPSELYWASRAQKAEALLAAREKHYEEIEGIRQEESSKRHIELQALEEKLRERERNLEKILLVLVGLLILLVAALVYFLSASRVTTQSSNFRQAVITPFASLLYWPLGTLGLLNPKNTNHRSSSSLNLHFHLPSHFTIPILSPWTSVVERQTSHVNNKASSSAFYLICFLIALASSLCIYFKIFQNSCPTSKIAPAERIIPTSNNWQLYARSFIAMYPSSLLQWVWRLGYWLLYLSGIAPR